MAQQTVPATSTTPTTTTLADPNQRATEFQPVSGGEETTSGTALLIAAYVIMWCLALLFVWSTWTKQKGLAARAARLEKALEGNLGRGASPEANGPR